MSEQPAKRRPWPWIIAALTMLAIAYPLSYGPWTWISSRFPRSAQNAGGFIYHPMYIFLRHGPDALVGPYLGLWSEHRKMLYQLARERDV